MYLPYRVALTVLSAPWIVASEAIDPSPVTVTVAPFLRAILDWASPVVSLKFAVMAALTSVTPSSMSSAPAEIATGAATSTSLKDASTFSPRERSLSIMMVDFSAAIALICAEYSSTSGEFRLWS